MNIANFKTRMLTFLLAALGSFQICRNVVADEFRLKDGRTLVGQLKGKTKEDAQWTVELASGTLVRFPGSQLETNGYFKTDDRIEKYKQGLQKVEPTAESHAAFAGWCGSDKVGLKEHALAHYRRALDFNPDFATARAALGYTKDASGRWVEKDEFMTEGKGKVKIGGRYVYPEVYAFNQEKEALKLNVSKWNKLVDQMQKDVLANGSKSAKALADLVQINDPFAVPAFGAKLLDAKTPTKLKLVYVQLLSQFQLPESVAPMVQATLNVDDAQVRDACIDSLSRFGREYAIATYIGILRQISSKTEDSAASTVRLNRAASGLNAFKADNAVLPLIEALVTKYKVTRTQQGSYNVAGGLTTPGKPETTIETAKNQEVLGALVNLTRQNFSFDEQRWLSWYASVHAAPMGDLRRDP